MGVQNLEGLTKEVSLMVVKRVCDTIFIVLFAIVLLIPHLWLLITKCITKKDMKDFLDLRYPIKEIWKGV
jgi:ABC-type glycerol-3-phosphate transport system permease component